MSDNSSNSSESSNDDYEMERWSQRRDLRNQAINQIQSISREIIPQLQRSQIPRTRRYIERNREDGHQRLYNDYFAPNPVYNAEIFRRRFRMRQHVFMCIVNVAKTTEPFFEERCDAIGRDSLTTLQKCTAAIRMLAYGESADRVDEYLRLGGTTAQMTLKKFAKVIIKQFGAEYLRRPTEIDLQRLLDKGAQRGFPGMMGSIDCMHWKWKNCPVAWRGQFQGRSGTATVILEAVASQDLWIWHSFFGMLGSLNDLNVLQRSPIFDEMLNGNAPNVNFMVNGSLYDTGYYLTDGIYSPWTTFIQSISLPQTPKHKLFAEKQEAARTDVERAFGVLQARFAVVRRPALTWSKSMLSKIMTTCIILHNMIVEDERDTYNNYDDPDAYNDLELPNVSPPYYEVGHLDPIIEVVQNMNIMRDNNRHMFLRNDLIENVWDRFEGN